MTVGWRYETYTYTCYDCGHTWHVRDQYYWWPIRFKWSRTSARRTWLSTHAWEVGKDVRGNRWLGWTLHLGPLKVCFGPLDWVGAIGYSFVPRCQRCGAAWFRDDLLWQGLR